MTRLIEAIKDLGLTGQVELDDRWVVFEGERCKVYIIEGRWGTGYFTWCDDAHEGPSSITLAQSQRSSAA